MKREEKKELIEGYLSHIGENDLRDERIIEQYLNKLEEMNKEKAIHYLTECRAFTNSPKIDLALKFAIDYMTELKQ